MIGNFRQNVQNLLILWLSYCSANLYKLPLGELSEFTNTNIIRKVQIRINNTVIHTLFYNPRKKIVGPNNKPKSIALQMENQAEPGLCIPYDVCPAEGDFLRPVRRRHSDQEGLHCDHEEICPAEDVGEEKLVCSGLLSAWIYRWVGLAIFLFCLLSMSA